MSRVGRYPVILPQGVDVTLDGQALTLKGKLGTKKMTLPPLVAVEKGENSLLLSPKNTTKEARVLWGTNRALLNNIVKGVTTGFTINLEIVGVGYRAVVQGKELVMQLGYSHEIRFTIPEGITIKCEKPTTVAIFGADKQLVGQVAAKIRSYRAPEPYKGKGIKYDNERLVRKEGKKK
jgi:large subunit ribosomal protein L6